MIFTGRLLAHDSHRNCFVSHYSFSQLGFQLVLDIIQFLKVSYIVPTFSSTLNCISCRLNLHLPGLSIALLIFILPRILTSRLHTTFSPLQQFCVSLYLPSTRVLDSLKYCLISAYHPHCSSLFFSFQFRLLPARTGLIRPTHRSFPFLRTLNFLTFRLHNRLPSLWQFRKSLDVLLTPVLDHLQYHFITASHLHCSRSLFFWLCLSPAATGLFWCSHRLLFSPSRIFRQAGWNRTLETSEMCSSTDRSYVNHLYIQCNMSDHSRRALKKNWQFRFHSHDMSDSKRLRSAQKLSELSWCQVLYSIWQLICAIRNYHLVDVIGYFILIMR